MPNTIIRQSLISLFLLIFMLPTNAVATEPSIELGTYWPEAIQKNEILKAVENTEKAPVLSVDITAPGLAVVRYGKQHIKRVVVTFAHDSIKEMTPEGIMENPTGFRVTSYLPIDIMEGK